jgi:hypothetical protein
MNGCERAASFDDTDRYLRWGAANARPLAGMCGLGFAQSVSN